MPDTEHLNADDLEHVNITSFLPVSQTRLQELKQATINDNTLRQLKNVIIDGWPEERDEVPTQITEMN